MAERWRPEDRRGAGRGKSGSTTRGAYSKVKQETGCEGDTPAGSDRGERASRRPGAGSWPGQLPELPLPGGRQRPLRTPAGQAPFQGREDVAHQLGVSRSGVVSRDNDPGNVVLVLGGPNGPPARCGRQVQVTSASLALRQPVVTPAQEKYDDPAPCEARPVPSSRSLSESLTRTAPSFSSGFGCYHYD